MALIYATYLLHVAELAEDMEKLLKCGTGNMLKTKFAHVGRIDFLGRYSTSPSLGPPPLHAINPDFDRERLQV